MKFSESDEPQTPGVRELVSELLQQAAGYARDYGRLISAEAREKARYLRVLGLSLAAAAVFLLFGFFFLTVALTAAIAFGLGSWGWASLIVGGGYFLIGLLTLIPAMRSIQGGTLRFDRLKTRVRKDKQWVKTKLAA